MSDAIQAAPAPDLPLVRKLAFAILALGQLEKSIRVEVPVVLPGGRAEKLGDLIIDAAVDLLATEPRPMCDAEDPRDRFLDMVREAAKTLAAAAPQKSRLVSPTGRPLR